MRPRKAHKNLAGSRIYRHGNKFYYFSPIPIENPATKNIAKWHSLCPVSEGILRAKALAAEIQMHNSVAITPGNMPDFIEKHRVWILETRQKKRPTEAPRIKLFEEQNREITRSLRVVAEAFENFDVDQVAPVDIAKFVDQWEGQRMAQVYLSRLSKFFTWAARNGHRKDNPCREVQVEKPARSDTYVDDGAWHKARDALMIGTNGIATLSGPMIQCYVDLCYLLYQRTTDIRLLKWSQVDMKAGVISFEPTKTASSSQAKVAVPISETLRAVLERAKVALNEGRPPDKHTGIKSIYVIHSRKGQPYQTRSLADAWERACARAGVKGATLRDIRAKAATDAKKRGYSKEQIRVALAHTDVEMTDTYLRGREAERSDVVLDLPRRPDPE